MEDKKQKKAYSFKLKKSDSPILKEFIENQSNFSETIRFLLYKYISENNTTENISYKFNELLFANSMKSERVSKLDDEKDVNCDDEISLDKEDIVVEEIPDCYK